MDMAYSEPQTPLLPYTIISLTIVSLCKSPE